MNVLGTILTVWGYGWLACGYLLLAAYLFELNARAEWCVWCIKVPLALVTMAYLMASLPFAFWLMEQVAEVVL